MLFRLSAATLAVACLATPVSAGLQSALLKALELQATPRPSERTLGEILHPRVIGLGAQPRPINRGLGDPSPTVPTFSRFFALSEVPEGAQFVDPVATTFGEAVYTSGPELIYDRSTGDLSVRIPALLGPPDTFGNRESIQPTGLTLFFSPEQRGGDPELPEVATFAPGLALGPDVASFPFFTRQELFARQAILNASTVQLAFNSRAPTPTFMNGRDQLSIDFGNQRSLEIATLSGPVFLDHPDFAGFEVRVPQLVVEGLADEQLLSPRSEITRQLTTVIEGGTITETVPFFLEGLGDLPPVGALVEYAGGSNRFQLLRPSQGFTFLATARIVPEPATALLLILGVGTLSKRRGR